jgi:hypothetical protein
MDYPEIIKVSAAVRAQYNAAQQAVIDKAVGLILKRTLAAERQLAAQGLTAAEKDGKLATAYYDAINEARVIIPKDVLESIIHAPEHRRWEYRDAELRILELTRLQENLSEKRAQYAKKLRREKHLGIAKGVGISILKSIAAAGEEVADEEYQVVWETVGNALDTWDEQNDYFPDAETKQTEKYKIICKNQALFESPKPPEPPAPPRSAEQLDEMDLDDMTDDEFQEWYHNTIWGNGK